MAQLNIDMIGRNRDDEPSESNTVYLVGSDRISSELHAISRAANASLPMPLTLDYEFNDPSDPEQLYFRSDHYSYAAKGIPVIFFTTGLHPDYHTEHRRGVEDRVRQDDARHPARLRDGLASGEPRSRAGPRQQGATRDEMTRPLLIIFLTIFVNLVGFGIIIPLLPFYAETFGASPLVVGLLFAVFSLCQLVASPALGDLSDRYGRRPVLVFSLAGTVVSFVMLALAHSLAMLFLARIVDGLSGGNISTARAYVADVTEPKDRARAYGLIGAAFGLGFIFGPALSGVLAQRQLHGADLGGGRHHVRRDGHGVGLAARNRAPRACGHRQPAPVPAGAAAAAGRPPRARDRFRVLVRASRSSRRPSRCLRRRASASMRRATGYYFAGLRRAGRRRPGRVHPAGRPALRRQDDVPRGPGLRRRRSRAVAA